VRNIAEMPADAVKGAGDRAACGGVRVRAQLGEFEDINLLFNIIYIMRYTLPGLRQAADLQYGTPDRSLGALLARFPPAPNAMRILGAYGIFC